MGKPKTQKSSRYIQLRLLRNKEYWQCGEDGQPTAATQAEIQKQSDAIYDFLNKQVPALIVNRLFARMRQSRGC